jgi:hypothetical protein
VVIARQTTTAPTRVCRRTKIAIESLLREKGDHLNA